MSLSAGAVQTRPIHPTSIEELDKILISFAGAIRKEVLALGTNDPSYEVQPLFSPTKSQILSIIDKAVIEAKEQAYGEAETEIFKDEITYGNHVIPKDWKKIDDVYIWFEAFHQGIKWRGIPGYVYEKPDGTFTAPFRGELIDVIKDTKNEYRETAKLTNLKGDTK